MMIIIVCTLCYWSLRALDLFHLTHVTIREIVEMMLSDIIRE
jgi:hypothetical protein